MKIGIFSTDFRKKVSEIKFHENPSSRSRVVPRERTERRDEANSLLTQFCERAYMLGTLLAPVNSYLEYVIEQYVNQQVYTAHVSS
jgi:hypothetical protein